jgi:hypothetical protein
MMLIIIYQSLFLIQPTYLEYITKGRQNMDLACWLLFVWTSQARTKNQVSMMMYCYSDKGRERERERERILKVRDGSHSERPQVL